MQYFTHVQYIVLFKTINILCVKLLRNTIEQNIFTARRSRRNRFEAQTVSTSHRVRMERAHETRKILNLFVQFLCLLKMQT